MFKIYFVKTETPNVFKRIDALSRVLFGDDTDIYFRNDCLTVKQNEYYMRSKEENLPKWNEVIGFNDGDSRTIEIHKPIPEMIQTAKDLFDIDLCFVDKEPNIPYDNNITVDVELNEGTDSHGKYFYSMYYGKYDMTDILAMIDYDCEIYYRIQTAFEKYDIGESQECYFNRYDGKCITTEQEDTMKKDFKDNFHINLKVNHMDSNE